MGNLPEREVRICMALHLFRCVPGTDRNNKTVRMKFAPFLSAEREGFEPDSAIYLRVKYFLFYLLWQVTIWKLSVHFLSEPVSKNLYYTANINILFYLHKLFLFFCIQKSSIGCCLVVRVLFKQTEEHFIDWIKIDCDQSIRYRFGYFRFETGGI